MGKDQKNTEEKLYVRARRRNRGGKSKESGKRNWRRNRKEIDQECVRRKRKRPKLFSKNKAEEKEAKGGGQGRQNWLQKKYIFARFFC